VAGDSSAAFDACLGEYRRAAAELCDVVERFTPEAFAAERPSEDPDTVSPRAICDHVVRAAHGYANALRKAQGMAEDPARAAVAAPADLRPALERALRFTAESVAPMRSLHGRDVLKIEFRVSSGAVYNPEILLEHAICHVLRHRRQLERW
jgi:uncharacterized damage-inducible protein DinB